MLGLGLLLLAALVTDSLPHAIPVCGYQEGRRLTVLARRRDALVLCPTRSLFRTVGSPSGMGGSLEFDTQITSWLNGEQLLYDEAASSRTNGRA